MPKINPEQIKGTLLRRKQALVPAVVPMGQNFAVLNIPGGQSVQPASVGNDNDSVGVGVVVAATTVGAHSLATVVGGSPISPKNLVNLRHSTDYTPIICSDRKVYGLLQCESAMSSGEYFNNTNRRLQISFVIQSFSYPGYEACTVEHIEGKSLNFEYIVRVLRSEGDFDVVRTVFEEPLLGSGVENGLTADTHKPLRQLIHFISEGPAEGFISGAYKEILPAADPFPTNITWWESDAKLKKIVDKVIVRNSDQMPVTTTWNIYNTDGSTIIHTVTDAHSYSGIFETNRVRTIT